MLDERHVPACTTWDITLTDEHAEPLRLGSSYLMRRDADAWLAVVHLNHRDSATVVAARSTDAAR